MERIGKELVDSAEKIVHRWHEEWSRTASSDQEFSDPALIDRLPLQIRMIGERLQELGAADVPEDNWKVIERLDPDDRMEDRVPVEEVVQEYALAVSTIRSWIKERGIEVSFREYSCLYSSIIELAAESVRRYALQQAEALRRDRAQYLAGVMHQLRNPLSTLSMQAELLAEDEKHADRSFCATLQRNVGRIQQLVDRILRLERFEPGESPVHPEEVCPAEVTEEIMSQHQAEAVRKGLRLEDHVDPSLRMKIDCGLFIDALGNLVHNAIKYTREGFVVVDAEEHHDEVVFCVRDSGPGVPPDKQSSLFKESQPGRAGGAGIGLQIAQHAAQAQGGAIEVESEVGRGSVFSLRLPRQVVPRDGE